MAEDERSLPLFPLNSVLFPGMPLPLRIFEERYKLMIGTCLVTDRTFGVSLIKEGNEVGGPALPFEIGTTARIVEVERLPDGQMNLVAVGVCRYRLLRIVEQEPYLVGRVAQLVTPNESVDPELTKNVAERFQTFARAVRSGKSDAVGDLDLSNDPELLSFQIAAALASGARLRQELLELDSPTKRLRRLQAIIRREHDTFRLLARTPQGKSIRSFSLN